jgi:hypothetical protein
MDKKQYEELQKTLLEIKQVLVDLGKIQESHAQFLKSIAINSQESNDWKSWDNY